MLLNALMTNETYFRAFEGFRALMVGESSIRFAIAHSLYKDCVAFSYPHEEYLYFKGDPNSTLRYISDNFKNLLGKELAVSNEAEKYVFSYENRFILKPIIYMAFEKILESKGFFVPRRTAKRALPRLDSPPKAEFIVPISDDVLVLRGFRYMIEIRPSGHALLWLDVYSPAYSKAERRRISPRRIREIGLMDNYHREAVLKPEKRLSILNEILDIICTNKTFLRLDFPDNDHVLFRRELLSIQEIEK